MKNSASIVEAPGKDRDYASRLERILASPEAAAKPPRELFGEIDDEFWFWLNSQGYREQPVLQEILPGMPDQAFQARFTGRHGDATLRDGFLKYRLFKQIVEANLGPLAERAAVLDFGCGWGRIIRFFLKDLDSAKIWGIDCQAEAVDVCTQTNRWGSFRVVKPMPPTGFRPNTFDVVYCYSVFSHLSEDAHQRWLDEFARILRPRGLFIATTRQRGFMKYCAKLRQQQDQPAHARGAAAAFLDTACWLDRYDRGEFCHDPPHGAAGPVGPIYGETSIPKQYVLSRWTDRFRFVDYLANHEWSEQNVIVVQKR